MNFLFSNRKSKANRIAKQRPPLSFLLTDILKIARLSFILLLTCLASYSQTPPEENGIQWVTGLTWDQVKQKAKHENKFIFIDAYTTWCGPCKKMDKEVYPDKNVGEVVNPKFISVKLQMDQIAKDNEETKSWYPIAKEFNSQYSIDGFPSFLFFNPEGKLVHKAIGYMDGPGFIDLAKDALTDPEKRYEKSVEKFKKGELNYALMPNLATYAFQNKKNKDLGVEILTTYKTQYLDKLTDDEVFQKKDLKLLANYCGYLINSKDRYFNLFYHQPGLADSIMGDKLSRQAVLSIIRKEELQNKLYKDGKPITFAKPQWKRYKRSIKKKYGEEYVNKIFPDYQIDFSVRVKDWENYLKYVNQKIRKIPPQVNGNKFGLWGDAWTLNSYAWGLFTACNDKRCLEKAIRWTDLAIELDTTSYNDDYYDTKANLLYRMGKIKEAIELEEFAVARSNNTDKAVAENLRKMKAGLPTWN